MWVDVRNILGLFVALVDYIVVVELWNNDN
jgi:hypothetical protein